MTNTKIKKQLTKEETQEIINILETRFHKNKDRHPKIKWDKILEKLENTPSKIWTLNEMEKTGGEPDVIFYDSKTDEYHFYDCSAESPKGRRSLCYDREALDARKKFKPENSAFDLANSMGVELLDETQYRELQKHGNFDLKTSTWIKTPPAIRQLGGALFCDRRYNTVFLYHNGADSYYGSRGFRGMVKV